MSKLTAQTGNSQLKYGLALNPGNSLFTQFITSGTSIFKQIASKKNSVTNAASDEADEKHCITFLS
jgi:hypothetical protein